LSYETSPRPICHENLPKREFGRIPRFALAPVNRLLTDAERRLFNYYANQADGFAPSFKEIYKNTGLLKCNASRIRKRLLKKGFIHFDPKTEGSDGPIYIKWNQIHKLAQQLGRDDLKKEAGVSTTPIKDIYCHRDLTIRQLHQQSRSRQFGERSLRDMTKDERKLWNWAAGQTESELTTVISSWAKPAHDEELFQKKELPF
jgi:hypothetical protein